MNDPFERRISELLGRLAEHAPTEPVTSAPADSGVPRTATHRRRRLAPVLVAAGLAASVVIGVVVARGGDTTNVSTSDRGTPAVPSNSTDATDGSTPVGSSDRFCAIAEAFVTEARPESYVGSAEHLADIETLRAAAPTELHEPLDTFAAFIASGAVDPADPASNETENWPSDVRAAIDRTTTYIATNCPSSALNSTPPSTTVREDPAGPATVSSLDPPPTVSLVELGSIPVPAPDMGRFSAAIGDLGVAITTGLYDQAPTVTTGHVLGFDGSTRQIELPDTNAALLAYGPGDIVYTTRGADPGDFSVVAIPLSGDAAGEAVAVTTVDINGFLEYPPVSFGHSGSAIVRRSDMTDVAQLVDETGRPTALDPPVVQYSADPIEVGEGRVGRVTSSTGTTWTMSIEASPERRNTYEGGSPPAPGADGAGVYWTDIGPSLDPTGDFGVPSQWVVARLSPAGETTWWSLPEGWSIVASDIWGTVAAKQEGTTLRVALVDFPTDADGPVPADRDFDLFTHCGIEGALIDGRWWEADPVLSDGNRNPPAGWINGSQPGRLRFSDANTATFTTDTGLSATLRRTELTAYPFSCD